MVQQSQTQVAQAARGQVAAPQQRKIDVLKSMLNAESVMEQFRNALKDNAPTFVASLIDLYNTDSKLQMCEPGQVIKEALKAAVLHLPVNKALGQAFIIPFYNTKKDERGNKVKVYEPVFQIGYKGLYQLAMRTGQYRIINADVVYEGELRKVSKLTGEIDVEGQKVSDKVVGYFAYIELNNGYHKALYMSVEEMAAHAKRYSKALTYNREATVEHLLELSRLPVTPDSNTVGWLGNFHGMAIKTVVRNLLGKYGYLSVTLQNAVATDTQSDTADKPTAAIVENVPQVVNADTVEYEDVTSGPAIEEAQEVVEDDINPGF